MRILALAILAIGTIWATVPARAQMYAPDYPVCIQVYAPIQYIDCSYNSLAQCAATASGRAAECIVNPYYANAYQEPWGRRHRRHPRAY
ncbi:MAG: DUF3551 domain-containing protein [Bradyrhizobium sp.]|uniref:DUF3551 domain-containing protein n=1 Tax=Bradyrhizobium sp. TaxID=376 RepID=UPI0011F86FB0|nr:DUF3551 domain-containing protein [Bradyrhizobium sp.]THD72477.1 MAG: DUF3551 domain-containing protein [Bradyrhizobium sp.]